MEDQDEVRCRDTPAPSLCFLELEVLSNSLRGVEAAGGARTRHYFW